MSLSILPPLVFLLPLAGAVLIAAGAAPRAAAVAVSAGMTVVSLALWVFYAATPGGFQFAMALPVAPQLGIALKTGVDGLGVLMLFLTSVVSLSAMAVSPGPESRPRLYYACLLLISAGAAGAFASLDLFFFYAFHELALIPTFILIGLWGHGNRTTAAWRATIYLGAGSFALLIGLAALVLSLPEEARTFDLPSLLETKAAALLPAETQKWIYLLLLAGFGSLVSLVPLHSWAPHAYASAPAPAAMLHAGVLKKFGLFGLIRVAQPLLPAGAEAWTGLLLTLLCLNVVYAGLATVAQRKLDLMLGYSSVMHMGYLFLGIASWGAGALGPAGTALLMVAHGLSVALLFGLAGEVRAKAGTLEFGETGGLASRFPALGFFFALAAFASIGLPGFANFPGELMVFAAGFRAAGGHEAVSPFHIAAGVALLGVLISAVYMLRAFGSVFLGKPHSRLDPAAADTGPGNRFVYGMLAAALLVFGFFPGLAISLAAPAVEAVMKLAGAL